MSYYTKEELLIKSYDTLYKIALKEKLLNIYTEDKTKSQLIELILEYRENKYFDKIVNKNNEGFVAIQKILDEKVVEISKDSIDIEVPHTMTIFSNKRINVDEGYYILINKNLKIDTTFILLVGANNYIYSIFSVSLDEEYINEIYDKYIFDSIYIERFNFELDFFENTKLIFFEKNVSNIFKKIYLGEKIEFVPKNLLCYSIKMIEFNIKKLDEKNKYFPILVMENTLISKYFTKRFGLYIRKIEDKYIYIDFFEDSHKTLKNKEYIFYGSYFGNLVDFFNNQEEEIKIYDDYLNSKKILKKKLVDIFLKELLDIVMSYSKITFEGISFIGLDLKRDEFRYINLPFTINYNLVQEKLGNGNFFSDKYLIISSEYNNFNISTNDFCINEKDINYEVNINTIVNVINYDINYESIIRNLLDILKIKISNIEFNVIQFNELMEKINTNGYLKIINSIEEKVKKAEKIFSLDFYKYEFERNDIYLSIQKNYYFLLFECYKLFDEYCNNINFNSYYIKEYKITINKEEIEYILSLKIYNFLNNFFKKYTVLDLLKKYKGVKLIGKFVNNTLFYNLLKEFIPGKIIKFSEFNKNNYNLILNTVEKYIEDIEVARIKCNNTLTYERKNLEIIAMDFKNEFKCVLNTKTKLFGYIDKLEMVIKINIKINNLETNESYDRLIYIPKEFYEKDEGETKIDQIYLDNIDNGIVRIFFFIEDVIEYKCAKRVNDQVYISSNYRLNICDV